MKSDPDPGQSMQRVKVGLTGLALVLLLIVFASAVLRTANRGHSAAGAGTSRPDIVANIASLNDSDPAGEPLAEIGVARAGPGEDARGGAARR